MTLKLLLGSAALLSGLLAGFYFAYATVIAALRDAPEGAEAMRRMNDTVERPMFLAVFLLAPLLALIGAVWVVIADGIDLRTTAALAGSLCVVAAFVLTIAVNVPLNQRLIAGTVEWAEFARTWGTWNLARTWLSVAGAVGLVLPAVR